MSNSYDRTLASKSNGQRLRSRKEIQTMGIILKLEAGSRIALAMRDIFFLISNVLFLKIWWCTGRHGTKGQKGDRGTSADAQQTRAPVVGFSATLDQNLPRSGEYRVVRFNVVLANHGGAYSPSTGVFTAPVNGSYFVGFSGVGYDGQDILLHLVRNGQRQLSAFDNSGCSCCGATSGTRASDNADISSAGVTSGKCAGSASNSGIIPLERGDRLWVELPDGYGMHNALYHNYAGFYGHLLYTAAQVNVATSAQYDSRRR